MALPLKNAKKCWICGSPASTGEHIVKASILKDLFGAVCQNKPLIHRDAKHRKRHLQSINSRLLKLHVLCDTCNNAATQPFDRAWDGFWSYLSTNRKSLHNGNKVRFYRVFGRQHSRRKLLDLHLYAVKLFGCVAAEFSIPLDLEGLSHAIRHRQPHRDIYMAIGKRMWLMNHMMVGLSDVNTIKVNDQCVFAVWGMQLDAWEMQFVYAIPTETHREGLKDAWNPMTRRWVRLKNLLPPE